MAEPESRPLKEWIGRDAVVALADKLARSARPFDRNAFVRTATRGLGALELKERVRKVAAALRRHLAPDYPDALAHVLETLPPPLAGTEAVTQGFACWPLCQFVEDYGLEHLELSLGSLHTLTQRFTAEYAIRPFLEREPEKTLRVLGRWMSDPSPHVRRLCSEGTRPLLPWGRRLSRFREDPSETRFVLDGLVDDPEAYVRRSVANHLNDVARDHAEQALEIAAAWQQRPSDRRSEVIRHGLRTLVKQGQPDALALLGYGPAKLDQVRLSVSPTRVAIGDTVTIALALKSRARRAQRLLIDYAVHFRRSDGSHSRKVFKWTETTLPASGPLELSKRHRFRQTSTRRLYAGEHIIEVLVNGRSLGRKKLRLRAGAQRASK